MAKAAKKEGEDTLLKLRLQNSHLDFSKYSMPSEEKLASNMFEKLDLNNDGVIDRQELIEAFTNMLTKHAKNT
jgi:Ca2+-binding EF-hand superfamily protein